MKKRAGLARALALDPELLFLDEPTSGLDPISANQFDELIGELQESLGLTVFMVTHDLDSLSAICDRIAVLVDKKIKTGTIEELRKDPPLDSRIFLGATRSRRDGRRVRGRHGKQSQLCRGGRLRPGLRDRAGGDHPVAGRRAIQPGIFLLPDLSSKAR